MPERNSAGRGGGARQLLRPRWVAAHLLVLLLVGTFVSLGMWQLSRREERRARNEAIEQRAALEPAPLESLLEQADDPEELRFRPVVVEGAYRPEEELLLRSRSRDGRAGWHVVTPLELDGGSAVLVDRGWVPYAMDEPPLEEAAPPPGRVRILGTLEPEHDPPVAARFAPRDPPEGPLRAAFYLDVERLQPQIPVPLEPVVVLLAEQEPPAPAELPLPPEPPTIEPGPHLSYALQWFSFALIGTFGYAALLRRTVRDSGSGTE